jgi:hypothetical protein
MSATGQPEFNAAAGTKLEFGAYSVTPAYGTTVGVRKFIGLPETKVDKWETTQVDAQNADGSPDMDKYFGFGKRDNGQLGFVVAAADDNINAVEAIKGVLSSFRVTLGGSGRQMMFAAGITSIKRTVGEKDEALLEVMADVSGPINFS